MGFLDDYDFQNLVNEGEKLVLDELGNQLEASPRNFCTCNDCVLDMAVLALNSLKPLYHVSLLGSLFASKAMDENDNYAASVREAVTKAIQRVSKNPSHPPLEAT